MAIFRWQYAFFICTGFLVVGGLIFLLGACFVVADKQKVDDYYEGKLPGNFSINIAAKPIVELLANWTCNRNRIITVSLEK